jgi:hypothetical protein
MARSLAVSKPRTLLHWYNFRFLLRDGKEKNAV